MINLQWFKEILKSEKEKELEQLRVDEAKLLIQKVELENDVLELQKKMYEEPVTINAPVFIENKPYKKVKFVNNVLTVVLQDGSVLSKSGAKESDFTIARLCITEDELLQVITSIEGLQEKKKVEAELAVKHAFNQGLEVLRNHSDFQFIDNAIYMKTDSGELIKRSIPELLLKKFAEILGSRSIDHFGYQSLRKFWLKCCLNPNAKSAEDLYEFLSHHQFKIDKHGNFYAYRRVQSKNTQNKELVEFVSNTYTKVKAVWKKKPSDYFVWQEDDGSFTFNKLDKTNTDGISTFYGNLEMLYLDLPNMQEKSYTSAHTGLEDYRVGEVISMPRYEGNDDNRVSCSRGFHAASKAYDYSGFGDVPILLIINPMDVLAVPRGEVGKLRTCRWFFAAVLGEDEKYILDDFSFDVTDLGDTFEEKCNINLQDYVQNSFAEEVKRHTFDLSPISSPEVTGIVLTLDKMKEIIEDRVIELDEDFDDGEDHTNWID